MDNLTAKNNLTAAADAVGAVLLKRDEVPPLRQLSLPYYLREVRPEVVRGPDAEHYIRVTVPKRGYNTYKRRGPKNWAIPPECDVKQLEAVFTLFLPTPFRCVAVRNALDKVAIYISSPPAREQLMKLLDKLPITHAVEVKYWNSFRPGSFREQFTIRFQDGNSFWIGVVLNGRKPEWGRVRVDFNPNKVAEHEVFQLLLSYLVSNTRPMHRTVKRFDLAVDIPVLRQDVFLVKDNRAYIERRHGQEWTQYLGAKSSTVGRVKLYNKQVEANLNHPLTRLEMTLDPATPYTEVNFPTVYYLDDLQLCFDETIKATDTERFILNAILQGCGTLEQLGRKTREKIKVLLDRYVKYIEVSPQEYQKIISQVNGYKNSSNQTTPTDPDRPPLKKPSLPDWVQEAEQSAQDETPLEITEFTEEAAADGDGLPF